MSYAYLVFTFCLTALIAVLFSFHAAGMPNLDEPNTKPADFTADWRVETERFPDFDGKNRHGWSGHLVPVRRHSDLAIAPDGSIYHLCNLDTWVGDKMDRDILLVKYNAKGKRLWYQRIGKRHSYEDGEGIALDARGNVYIAGFFGKQGFLASYRPDGKRNWTHLEKESSQYFGLALSQDSIYVVGATTTRIARDAPRKTAKVELLTSRFDMNGRKQWSRQFQSVNLKSMTWGTGIAVHNNRQIYVAGIEDRYKSGEPPKGTSDHDTYLIALDSAGNRRWTRKIGTKTGPGANDRYGNVDQGVSLVTDSKGHIYVAGHSSSHLDRSHEKPRSTTIPTLLKFAPNGDQKWVVQIPKSVGHAEINRASITNDERIVMAGKLRDRGVITIHNIDGELLDVLYTQLRDISVETAIFSPSTDSDEDSKNTSLFITGIAMRNRRAPDFDNRPSYCFLMRVSEMKSDENE